MTSRWRRYTVIVDAIQGVSRPSAQRLQVVFAPEHLGLVDGGDLRVVQAGDVGIEGGGGLDQVRSRLGDAPPLSLSGIALAAVRDQAAPAAKVSQGRGVVDVADEGDTDSGAVLADFPQRFQMALGMQLSLEGADRVQACLFPLQAELQALVIEALGLAIEGNHLLGFAQQVLDPGRIGRLLGGSTSPSI